MDVTQQQAVGDQVPTQSQPAQPELQQPPFAQGYGGAQQAVGQVVQSGAPLRPFDSTQGYAGQVGSVQKEQLVQVPVPEKVPLVEVSEHEKIPEDVEGWMEKLEQAGEIKIPEAIKRDEQILMDNAVPTTVQDTIVLPLTQQGAVVAAKKTVSDSARWLVEWCKRLINMLGARAKYRD